MDKTETRKLRENQVSCGRKALTLFPKVDWGSTPQTLWENLNLHFLRSAPNVIRCQAPPETLQLGRFPWQALFTTESCSFLRPWQHHFRKSSSCSHFHHVRKPAVEKQFKWQARDSKANVQRPRLPSQDWSQICDLPENSHYTVAWIKGSSVMFSSKIMRTSGWKENRRWQESSELCLKSNFGSLCP